MKSLKNLVESAKILQAALPKIAQAYSKKLIGDVADNEVQTFRKTQCEECVLFTGVFCDKNKLAAVDNSVITLEQAEKYGVIYKDSYGLTRSTLFDNKLYVRGCGCPQTGAAAKWKLSFTDIDLEKEDGTAPCPRNRWTIEKFNNWKNGSFETTSNNLPTT